jgi:FSR family fosmidomycin resistance protein-like MFS transporter
MLIGLAVLGLLYRTVPIPEAEGLQYSGFMHSLRETLGAVWKPILLIWMVMVLRSVVGQSFLTFMPVHLALQGYPLVAVGGVISLFVVAGTTSGLAAGYLSDRIGYKPVFYVTHILMTPALLLFLHLSGNWVYFGAFMAGLFVLASLPVGVVMAQTLAPRGRSMVASLMMGFAYGLGGAFSPLIGWLADIYSIEAVLQGVALIPLLTVVLIFFFPTTYCVRRSL